MGKESDEAWPLGIQPLTPSPFRVQTVIDILLSVPSPGYQYVRIRHQLRSDIGTMVMKCK